MAQAQASTTAENKALTLFLEVHQAPDGTYWGSFHDVPVHTCAADWSSLLEAAQAALAAYWADPDCERPTRSLSFHAVQAQATTDTPAFAGIVRVRLPAAAAS
jgi:hypothetical protein